MNSATTGRHRESLSGEKATDAETRLDQTDREIEMNSVESHRAITLLTQGHSNPFVAKTAISMLRYRGADVAAVLDAQSTAANTGELFGIPKPFDKIPVVNRLPENSDSLYLGIAPPGGNLPPEWKPLILAAIEMKMDVVSGLHDFLVWDDDYVAAARRHGVRLIDVRQNQLRKISTGQPFSSGNLRIHSVGQDCSVGKMVATLEINQGLVDHGSDSVFLATGQTGIMIAGTGVPVDCVISDFINGAVENLVREHDHHDFLMIEGQGSISHPAYSAVTAGLLHGCRPDGLVFCYEAGRRQVKGLEGIDLPSIANQMDAYLKLANLAHRCQFLGFAVNTRNLTEQQARVEVDRIEQEFELPACDVYREGPAKLVDSCIALKQRIGNAP